MWKKTLFLGLLLTGGAAVGWYYHTKNKKNDEESSETKTELPLKEDIPQLDTPKETVEEKVVQDHSKEEKSPPKEVKEAKVEKSVIVENVAKTEPKIDTSKWVSYENSKLGLYVKYPPNWFTLEKPQLQTPILTISFLDSDVPFEEQDQTIIVVEDQKVEVDLEKHLTDSINLLGVSGAPTKIISKKKRKICSYDAVVVEYTMKKEDGKEDDRSVHIWNCGVCTERRLFLFQRIKVDSSDRDNSICEAMVETMILKPGNPLGEMKYVKMEKETRTHVVLPTTFSPLLFFNKDIRFYLGQTIDEDVRRSLMLKVLKCSNVGEIEEYIKSKREIVKVEKHVIFGEERNVFVSESLDDDDPGIFYTLGFVHLGKSFILEAKCVKNESENEIEEVFKSLKSFRMEKLDTEKKSNEEYFEYENYEYGYSIQFPTTYTIQEHSHEDPMLTIREPPKQNVPTLIETVVSIRDLPSKKLSVENLHKFLVREINATQGVNCSKKEVISIENEGGKIQASQIMFTQFDATIQNSLKFFMTSVLKNKNQVISVRSYGLEEQLLGEELQKTEKIHRSFRVFDANDGRHMYTWNTAGKKKIKLPVTSVRFRPYTQTRKCVVLVAGSGGVVQHWHITSGRCLNSITEKKNQVYAVDYRPDGKYFATAGKDHCVRVYDEATKQIVALMKGGDGIKTTGHCNRVFAVKFHPTDPNILLSGGWDNTVQIWDKRKSSAIRRIFSPHVCGDSIDMDDNGVILTGSWRNDRQLQLWDFGTGKLIEDVKLPADPKTKQKCNVYCAAFNHKKATLICAGGSGSNEAKVIDRYSGKVVGEVKNLDKAVYSVAYSPDNLNISVGGGDGNVYILYRNVQKFK